MRNGGWCWALVAAYACGGGDGRGTASDGGSNGATGALTLEGTWDLMGPRGQLATITVGTDALRVEILAEDAVLEYDGASLTFTDEHGTSDVSFEHESENVAVGALSLLRPGGSWTFSRNEEGCDASLNASGFHGSCDARDLPLGLPRPEGEVTAVRTETLESSFGELGGVWRLTSTGSSSCELRIEGAGIDVSCDFGGREQELTIAFRDDMASGTANGVDFAAVRR